MVEELPGAVEKEMSPEEFVAEKEAGIELESGNEMEEDLEARVLAEASDGS